MKQRERVQENKLYQREIILKGIKGDEKNIREYDVLTLMKWFRNGFKRNRIK